MENITSEEVLVEQISEIVDKEVIVEDLLPITNIYAKQRPLLLIQIIFIFLLILFKYLPYFFKRR